MGGASQVDAVTVHKTGCKKDWFELEDGLVFGDGSHAMPRDIGLTQGPQNTRSAPRALETYPNIAGYKRHLPYSTATTYIPP